jgi:hypothetical protein
VKRETDCGTDSQQTGRKAGIKVADIESAGLKQACRQEVRQAVRETVRETVIEAQVKIYKGACNLSSCQSCIGILRGGERASREQAWLPGLRQNGAGILGKHA